MSIEEVTSLCEQHFPDLGFITHHSFQVCKHPDGDTTRTHTFCISVIPNAENEDVRIYKSHSGFADCAQELIEKESTATPAA